MGDETRHLTREEQGILRAALLKSGSERRAAAVLYNEGFAAGIEAAAKVVESVTNELRRAGHDDSVCTAALAEIRDLKPETNDG